MGPFLLHMVSLQVCFGQDSTVQRCWQYVFEGGHSTVCKGFGPVNCYFVQSTGEAPPDDLLERLGLQPDPADPR